MSVSIWNATEQKLEQVGGNVNINDSVTSADSTWSSEKIHDSLVDYDNAKVREFLPSGDLNTITTEGLYSIGHLNNFTNAPRTTDEHGVLRITKSANDMVCQEWMPRNGNMSYRVQISGTTWGSWAEFALMNKIQGGDAPSIANNATTVGTYLINRDDDVYPVRQGFLTVTKPRDSANCIMQEVTIYTGLTKYVRGCWFGTWNAWKKVTLSQ